MKLTTAEMELGVMNYFNPRVNLCVPNVSWGFLNYEADILVLRPSGYCEEVEIKVSVSDLKAEAKKKHNHESHRIRKLWFAIPRHMETAIDLIPLHAGILVADHHENDLVAVPKITKIRNPDVNKRARGLGEYEMYQVARLGALRIYGLKKQIHLTNQGYYRKAAEE